MDNIRRVPAYGTMDNVGTVQTSEKMKESVNHPDHYNQGGMECFDVIKAFLGDQAFEDFCVGNVVKYVLRYRHKGQVLDDLKKARFYIDEILKRYEKR